MVGVAQAKAGQDAVQSGSTGLADGGRLESVGQVGQIIEGAGRPAVPGHGLAVQRSGDELPALNGGGHGVVSAAQCGAGVAVVPSVSVVISFIRSLPVGLELRRGGNFGE